MKTNFRGVSGAVVSEQTLDAELSPYHPALIKLINKGGVPRGELVVIGGRKCGKSLFYTNIIKTYS